MRGLAMLVGSALFLGGCALSQSTDKVVVDYNRDFAKSRNELLLLNVLRAAAREPLQFSTMGTVSGPIGNSSGLTIPFTNLIAGGANVISPSLTFSDAVNPTVSITPLANKEFATGILKPMGIDTIQLFLHNGWDPEFILPLIVGGVVCPDRRLVQNSGDYLEWNESAGAWQASASYLAFKKFFYNSAPNFSIASRQGDPVRRSYDLSDKEAVDAIRNGFGPGQNLVSVEDLPNGRKKVTVEEAPDVVVRGFDVKALCDEIPVRLNSDGRPPQPLSVQAAESIPGARVSDKKGEGKVMFRSVGSIIQYLGESHRARYLHKEARGLTYWNRDHVDQILFRIGWGLGNQPRAVSTRFQETTFFIDRMELGERESVDRTLKTLAFLDQLIALHTSESSIRGAQPVISVN